MTEPMIAGKTHSEIKSMGFRKRYKWSSKLLPKEREDVKRIVKEEPNDLLCQECDKPLIGQQRKNCSDRCRSVHYKKQPRIKERIRKRIAERRKDPKYRERINKQGRRPSSSRARLDSESMIAGRTHSEIKSMGFRTRGKWYSTISKEEKEEAMKVVGWARASASSTGRVHTEETKVNISVFNHAWWTPERRSKVAGKNSPYWRGGSSRYCYRFTSRVKEHIRNLCGRTCTICGRSILQYFRMGNKRITRLHIDHLDENKMQGCDDWEWRLTALCPSCHLRMNKQRIPYHLLLRLLLLNNKKHQTNFLFG